MEKTAEEEVKMMSTPERWPYPVLPLKKRNEVGQWPDLGVLFADAPTVWRCALYQLGSLNPEEIPKEEFESFEALVAAGWVID